MAQDLIKQRPFYILAGFVKINNRAPPSPDRNEDMCTDPTHDAERPVGESNDVHNALNGSVKGTVIQAGTVQGGIYIQAPDHEPPWQLPPVGRLTDRTEELAALDSYLASAEKFQLPTFVTVSGLGGVGKTALTLSWLTRLRERFSDGQLYVDLKAQSSQGPPTDSSEILGRFLRALSVPPDHIPHAADERMALYRSLTATRQLVVLLDDAATAAQVRPLLPGGQNVAVITSRWRLSGLSVDGGRSIHLAPLKTDAALELLRITLSDKRVQTQYNDARELVELCAGLPLAVRVVGARLAARPHRRIRIMVHEMSREQDRLQALAIEGDRGVRAALDISYDSLSPPAARLYRRLALHPGAEFAGEVAIAALGETDEAGDPAPTLLEMLHDANLLTDIGDERYRFHDLVRLHAASKTEKYENDTERTATFRRILDHYLATATRAEEIMDPHHRSLPRNYGPSPAVVTEFHGRSDAALAWMDRELGNLMQVIRRSRQMSFLTVTWQLTDAMWSLFVRRKHYDEWRIAHIEGVAAARQLGDQAAECRMLTSGGMGELDTANYQRALDMFEQANQLFSRTGDGLGLARTANYKGLAHRGLGNIDAASALFEEAAATLPQHGDRRAGALAQFNLAEIYLLKGQYAESIADVETAHRVLLEQGDPYNAARAAGVHGRSLLGLGRLEAAESHLNNALSAVRGVSEFETAHTLEALAELALRQGLVGIAQDRYHEALGLYDALGLTAQAEEVKARLARSEDL